LFGVKNRLRDGVLRPGFDLVLEPLDFFVQI
jgi:hypothetical protein